MLDVDQAAGKLKGNIVSQLAANGVDQFIGYFFAVIADAQLHHIIGFFDTQMDTAQLAFILFAVNENIFEQRLKNQAGNDYLFEVRWQRGDLQIQ